MFDLEHIIEVVNEVVETCRMSNHCSTCPYWDNDKGECQILMKSLTGNTPYEW